MLRFSDGCDSYAQSADLVKHKWNFAPDEIGAWEWNATEGVNGGGCIKHIGAAGDRLAVKYRPLDFSAGGYFDRGRTLFWFKIAAPPAAETMFCRWHGINSFNDTLEPLQLSINQNGLLVFSSKAFVSLVGYVAKPLYTGEFNVCDNEWHCLEVYFDSPTYLRVGFDDFILFDGAVSWGSGWSNLFSIYSLGVDTWVDDIVLWDDAGDNPTQYNNLPELIDIRADEFEWDSWNNKPINGDLNNFPERGQDDFFYWMGRKQMTTLRPINHGLVNDFTVVGAPSKRDAINGAMPNLAKYVTAKQAGSRMLYKLASFPYVAPLIHAVALNFLNTMDDHGSIVAQAEARQGTDIFLGVRRRISGAFLFGTTGINSVPNGGPNFVDTSGWVEYHGIAASIVNGRLRIEHSSTSAAIPRPLLEIAVPVTPGTSYRVSAQTPIRTGASPYGVHIKGGLNGGGAENLYLDTLHVPNATTGPTLRSEVWHIPPDISTLYIHLVPGAPHIPNFDELDFISIEEVTKGFDFKYFQWALRKDPTTLVNWTRAGLNSAEFGMRIAP